MEWVRCSIVLSFLFLILMGLFAAPSSSFPSTFAPDDVFQFHTSASRNLLQTKKGCPVSFEFLNYTIITSQCKGPRYPPSSCCAAFKDFACPYAEVLNDLTNDCSTIMFSYINLNGKYPPGLFADECRDGELGLDCPALPPSQVADLSGTLITHDSSLFLIFIAGFVVALFQLL